MFGTISGLYNFEPVAQVIRQHVGMAQCRTDVAMLISLGVLAKDYGVSRSAIQRVEKVAGKVRC